MEKIGINMKKKKIKIFLEEKTLYGTMSNMEWMAKKKRNPSFKRIKF